MIAAGEVAESKFWLELAVDESILAKAESKRLQEEYSKLGFMIHKPWKEWRKL